MTRKRHRLRRFAKWAGVFVCVVVASTIATSAFFSLSYDGKKSTYYFVGGSIGVIRMPSNSGLVPRWHVVKRPFLELGWLPELSWKLGPQAEELFEIKRLEIPVYFFLLAFALPTYILFRRDRRHPPGHCQNCGYDLTGNESGTCPECGTQIALNE
jgi:hypothetical protein